MGTDLLRKSIHDRFQVEERGHACAILKNDFPAEFEDIQASLEKFTILHSHISVGGGNKSPIAHALNGSFANRNWAEKHFDVMIRVDGVDTPSPTHSIDYFKNRVGIELEWNNKDPFFDRDLNNFRLLHQIGVLSVGVLITRLWELQEEFKRIGRGASYGMSTTHWDKLIPKVNGGGAGGCPLLLIGLGFRCYDVNR